MRAFRVIRLFGRLGSLRDIISALTAAIIPVKHSLQRQKVNELGNVIDNLKLSVQKTHLV